MKKDETTKDGEKKIGTRLKGKYESFTDLKEHLESAPKAHFTMVANRLMLENHTFEDFLKELETIKKKEYPKNNDFRSRSDLKAHLQWLAKRGFQISFNKKEQFKLTGYEAGKDQPLDFPSSKTSKTVSD